MWAPTGEEGLLHGLLAAGCIRALPRLPGLEAASCLGARAPSFGERLLAATCSSHECRPSAPPARGVGVRGISAKKCNGNCNN